MSEPLSSRFIKIFNDLPPEARQTLLEKSVAEVLDQLPPDVARKIHSSALKVQTNHQNVPRLDIKGKRKQVGGLLEILDRESKMFVFADRTSREEIVSEILQSLTGWLNQIWSTFYEHHMQFAEAHACLLFVAEVLNRLDGAPNPAGCKCDLLNLPIRVTIKDKTGKCITKLRVRGPQNLERLLLWIWRDLLLCILAKGTKEDQEQITSIFDDLEAMYGFPMLERMLCGGKKPVGEEEEDEEEIFLDNESLSDVEDEEDDSYTFFNFLRCNFHSKHWDARFIDERVILRNKVEDYLFGIFSITPNLPLYDSIMDVSLNPLGSGLRASGILSEIAGASSDTLAGALSIEVSKNNPTKILSLLDQYTYLLRPRDSVTLQCAAAVLGDSPHHARGLGLLETGLYETLADIQMAVRGAFLHIDDPVHKKELVEIIKLRSGSPARRDRIDAWSQAVSTSQSIGFSQFMAAMMFGIMPGMPGIPVVDDSDDASDLLNLIDMERPGEADLDDIREELRPNLKRRFEGWTQLATVMKGGVAAAAKAYVKAVEIMPFLRATDIVNEMIKLGDRPGKAFVSEALESVSSFCKAQRKKLSAIRKEKQKQDAPKAAAAARAGGPGLSTSTSAAPTAGAVSPAPASNGNDRRMEDDMLTLSPLPVPFSSTFHPPENDELPQPAANPAPGTEIPFRVFQGMEDVD